MPSRREFLKNSALASVGISLSPPNFGLFAKGPVISCQQYTWFTYLRREGINWADDLDYSFEQVISSGLTAFEPSFADWKEVQSVGAQLKKRNLQSASLYVNSLLHEEEKIEESISQVLRIAKAAKALGTRIIVTNPSPIKWGSAEDKTDAQLIRQAKALDRLGAKLRGMGISLAYHNHDAEMRRGAREFHHMMVGTDPENVRLCLDAHWIYRGAGDSEVAVFDIFRLYADRVVELHLRQSKESIWTEVFGKGDLDYERLAEALLARQQKPHLVLEQAVEKGTPKTLSAIEAHRQSLAYAQTLFRDFGNE